MQPTMTYIPQQRAGEAASVAIADVWGGLILGGLLLAAMLWRRVHQRQASAAREAEQASQQLRPGHSVVSGKVASDGSEDAPVAIEIDQTGRQWKGKHGWHVTWKEVARRVNARPFYIVRPNGERVRVEPSNNVFLVDQLDGEVRTPGAAQRTRTARLTIGETVYASGELARGTDPQAGGYRDGGIGWVLRPRAGERMLISTEPQAARHERRARFHRGWIIGLWISIALIHGAMFGTYHLLHLGGTVVTARTTSTSTYKVWVKPRNGRGYWRTHYVLEAEYRDEAGTLRGVKDEVSLSLYTALQRDRNVEIPFRVLPSLGLAQVGPTATVAVWKLVVSLIGMLLLLILYPSVAVASRPWYDKKRVSETVKGTL